MEALDIGQLIDALAGLGTFGQGLTNRPPNSNTVMSKEMPTELCAR
jgi:hypothetical protein